MHIKKLIVLGVSMLLFSVAAQAQDYTEPAYIVNMDSMVFNPSARQIAIGNQQLISPQNLRWSKTVYRFVSLTDSAEVAANSYLAEPKSPILYYTKAGEASEKRYYYNLIGIILRLLDEKKITAYTFDTQAVSESFSREESLTPDSALLKLGLERTRRKAEFDRADLTFAGSGVTGYLIKELWYVDGHTSQFGCSVEAIAPVVMDQNSRTEFTPAFWITYRSLQPYLPYLSLQSSLPGMTFDAYFKKRMYKGLIYKVQNPQNKTLWSECATSADPASCRKEASDRIQAEIDSIPARLWDAPVQIQKLDPKEKKAAERAAQREKLLKERELRNQSRTRK
ncbi:MAG: gliding motility protein GldN [Bacteroidales bacterium]